MTSVNKMFAIFYCQMTTENVSLFEFSVILQMGINSGKYTHQISTGLTAETTIQNNFNNS